MNIRHLLPLLILLLYTSLKTFSRVYETLQKTSCSIAERSFSLGTLAESVEALGTVSGQFVPQLLPLFMQGACDEDDEVRSNAIYGLGVLGQHGELSSVLEDSFVV